jgi:hypothetical protein
MSRLKGPHRPRSPCESFLEDSVIFRGSGSGGSHIVIDTEEGLGNDVWLAFEPLEKADVRTDSQGVLAIKRRATLGEDGKLWRRIRI